MFDILPAIFEANTAVCCLRKVTIEMAMLGEKTLKVQFQYRMSLWKMTAPHILFILTNLSHHHLYTTLPPRCCRKTEHSTGLILSSILLATVFIMTWYESKFFLFGRYSNSKDILISNSILIFPLLIEMQSVIFYYRCFLVATNFSVMVESLWLAKSESYISPSASFY